VTEGAAPSPPPQAPPAKGEEAVVDDRRRFKELWKELLFARLLVGGACGAVGCVLIVLLERYSPACSYAVVMLAFAAPSAVALRGRASGPLVALAVGLSLGLMAVVGQHVAFGRDETPLFATVVAAMGVTEGLRCRSLATVSAGIVGGAASGVLGWRVGFWVGFHLLGESAFTWALPGAAAVASVHLGLGVSLALGRWVRDLPKRKADPGGAEGQDAAMKPREPRASK